MARPPFVLSFLLLLVTFVALWGSAHGASTYTVCASGCNATTISEAFGLASQNDTVSVEAGVYDQETAFSINTNLHLSLPTGAVTVVYSGEWLTLTGAAHLDIADSSLLVLQGAQVVVESDAWLNSHSPLYFTDISGSSAITVAGRWNQWANVAINSTSVTGALVVLPGGTWNQYGNISMVVSHRVPAVRFEPGGQWFQRGVADITMTPGVSTTAVAAVDMSAGGLWLHMMDSLVYPLARLTLSGSEIYGVHLGADSNWGHYGRLAVIASQSATGVLVNSTTAWDTRGPSIFTVDGATGVRFAGPTAKWSQLRNATFALSGGATGVEFSRGGKWLQFTNMVISQSADASSTGVACGSSADCCQQVRAPTLVRIFSGLNAAGRENDCAVLPSPSPLPQAVGLSNTTASFGSNASSVALYGDAKALNKSLGVQLSLSGLTLGFDDARAGLDVASRTDTNTTDGVKTTYLSQLDAFTNVSQSFTYFAQARRVNFGGVEFLVAAGTVKWSFSLDVNKNAPSASLSSGVAAARKAGFTLRYRLDGLTANTNGTAGHVERMRDTPQVNMTTFVVTLGANDTSAAQVEVLNVAAVDGNLTQLGRIDLVWVNGTAGNQGHYSLELLFPPFDHSVAYDPSLGLGVLLGRNSDGDQGTSTSSSDVGLIVGVAVAIPIAVGVVLVAIAVGIALAWHRRRRWLAASADVDFSSQLDDAPADEQL